MGQIAHDKGEEVGKWGRTWERMSEGQRAEWEAIAQAVRSVVIETAATTAVPMEEVREMVEECRDAATWEYASEFDFITEVDLMTKAANMIERLAGIKES